MGKYVCECGKEFEKANTFNGHKSQCHIHLGDERYKLRLTYIKKRRDAGLQAIKKITDEKREKSFNNWKNEKHICEYCGNLLTEMYGSGRFCGASCARKFSSNINKDEKNRKISDAAYRRLYGNTNVRRRNHNNESSESECKLPKIKVLSEATRIKISQSAKINYSLGKCGLKHGSHKEFSKSERIVDEIFRARNITFAREVSMRKSSLGVPGGSYYSIDFLINENIVLEIDGSSHNDKNTKKVDKEKEDALIKNGFRVFRIKYTTESKLREDVELFLCGIGV